MLWRKRLLGGLFAVDFQMAYQKMTDPTNITGVAWLRHWLRCSFQASGQILRLSLTPHTWLQIPRLLTEGREPIRRMIVQAHNSREFKRLEEQRIPITFVTSYARSGNTWMRYLLSDFFLQREGVQTSTALAVHPDRIIPDYYSNVLADRDESVRTPGVLVKSHDIYEDVRAKFTQDARGSAYFKECRHLYLFRAPQDSLVSLYHLGRREKYVNGMRKDIDLFCQKMVPAWIEHVTSYLDAADRGAIIFFVAYEQMLADVEGTLGEVLRWIDMPYTQAMLETAACNMQFKKLKMTDRNSEGQPGLFRYGRSGGGVIELQPSTIGLINEQTSKVMERLIQRAKRTANDEALSRLASAIRAA